MTIKLSGYLKNLQRIAGVTPLLAVHPRDERLVDAAREHDIEVLLLDDETAGKRIWRELIQPFVETLQHRLPVLPATGDGCIYRAAMLGNGSTIRLRREAARNHLE